MKTIKIIALGCITFILATTITFAQTTTLEQVKAEIKEASKKEQNALRDGNCDVVLAFMDDNISLLANGNVVPSKTMIGRFCTSMKRPFPKPVVNTLEVYPLNTESAYTIKTLEYPKNEKVNIKELVTKIWTKKDGSWKITHLHSTVNEVSISK